MRQRSFVRRAAPALAVAALGMGLAACDRTAPSITRLNVAEPARPEAPLGVAVEVSTDEPARLAVEIADDARLDRLDLDGVPGTGHIVPLVGLRPGRTHSVTFIATDAAGNQDRSPPLIIETDPLPDDFPPLETTVSRPDRMEPGWTLLNVYRWGDEGNDRTFGLLVAVDASGEVVWYYRADHTIMQAIPLANGNLLYMASLDGIWGILVEIDILGNVVRRWHSRAAADHAPPGSILVDTDSLHHDVVELPSGNLVALGSEIRAFDDYPTSEEDPDAPRETRDVIGDVIVEFAPGGSVVQEWPLLDAFDPYRIGYDSLGTGFWEDTYRALGHETGEAADWAHANALAHDARDDTFVVSLRHQDALVKVDRGGGARWILGSHDGWNEPWRERLLEPEGELEWPYHGHGVEVTPHGTILVFDNGNRRALPFAEPMPAEESYSRAVEYEVDAGAMRIRQRWAYGGAGEERFYSSFLSDADWLPETGNVLVTDGARTREVHTEGDEPDERRWARILEVTSEAPAEVVFELVIDDDSPTGWHVYRAGRWNPPLRTRAP
ncbi:MAG: aryl-sulfate sulfotransferase [Acidobacteria bacterium]|nr:aryl-sulfate sulfotransferase [Acidobacteriota bacterium]